MANATLASLRRIVSASVMIISVLAINFAAIPVHADVPTLTPVTGVTVDPTSATVNIGSTQQLTDTVTPAEANQNVTWSSDTPSVATVDGTGLVTAVAAGSATITVTTEDGGLTATSAITVPAPAPSVTTEDASGVSSSDATLNATNGPVDADGHSIWVSTSSFDTSSPNIPAGVYSTPDFGALPANGTFSATLSSLTSDAIITGGAHSPMPAITPDTTYYYTAWVNAGGNWIPGGMKTVHTDPIASPTPGATTNAATGIASDSATVNGTNGGVDADNTSFWWGTTAAGPFAAEADPNDEFPAGWNHDLGLGGTTASQAFSELLSSLTPNTTYYFAAWSHVAGTWYPGAVEQFTTSEEDSGPTPTTVVVDDNHLNNWYFYNDQGDSVLGDTTDHGFVSGPATAPAGDGSAHLTKTTNDKYGIATAQFAGTALSDITHLAYSTYRASGTSAQAPSLGFDVDSDTTDGDTSYQGRLTYEPYFTQTVNTGEWQTWDTLADSGTGNWWFSHATLSGGAASACTQGNPCTWSELLAAYPHAAMRSVGQLILRTNGADGEAADMNVDKLTLGTSSAITTYDFEPVAVPTCSTDDTTFDTFDLGSVNGQHGWQVTNPSFDQAVVANSYGITSFGCKTLRISDAVTSGSFGDQIFSYSAANEAGETAAVNNGYSGGTRQNHFEAQFDIASTQAAEQTGMHLSVSPDRGDGARMSYLRFDDQSDGMHVYFDDVTDAGPLGTVATFNEDDIATLDRSVPHTIKFSMDFVDGAGNDTVKIYIDGTPVYTGTSWEDYYRYDPEQAGSGNQVPTVDSLLFRESGTQNAADAGKGFLIDNVNIGTSPTPTVTVTIDKFIDGAMATAESANSDAFPMTATWNNLGADSGTGDYALSTVPFNSANAYEAVTENMNLGSSYTTNENTAGNDVVGASCSDGKPYALDGYSSGATLSDAESAEVMPDAPSFTNMQNSEYVIVHNVTCPTDTEAPSVPVLTSPANGGYENTNDFYFNWENSTDDSAGPLSYDSQFTMDSTEVGGVLQNGIWASTTPTNTIHSQGAPDGTWYWQVRATDPSSNHSDWSDIWNVTIDTHAPAAPTITSPADGTHGTTASFTDVTWTDESDSGSPVGYIYQSAYDSGFTSIAYTSPLLSTTDQPTPGTPEGTYYIHVKSVDAAGNESAWSDPIMVVVDNTIEAADDHQAPVITLNGDSTITLTVGDTYTEQGATATDNVDGTDPVVIGGDTVDTSTAGTYVVTYNATDDAGNAADEVTRTVIVNEASTTTGGTGNTGGLHRQPGSSTFGVGSSGGSVLGASVFEFLTDFGTGSSLDPDVTELQKILIADGYLSIPAPTGFFGPLTQAAVKLYQGAHGISATGFVGPLTRNALNQGTGQDESGNTIGQQIADLMKQVEDLQKQLDDATSTSH